MVDRAPSGFATCHCCYVGIEFGREKKKKLNDIDYMTVCPRLILSLPHFVSPQHRKLTIVSPFAVCA